jgi:hypothetical protein
MKRRSLRGLLARLAAAVVLAVGLMAGSAATAWAGSPDPENCDPSNVPDDAGSGMPGRIDDQPTGGDGSTMYERYGWSGLQWHTCDLADPPGRNSWYPDATLDFGAWLDTSAGNVLLGIADTLAAFMTQLNEWVSNPGGLMAPIDSALVNVTSAVKAATWSLWAGLLVVIVAVMIAARAAAGDVRRALRQVLAVVLAATAIAALGATWVVDGTPKPGAVALGQAFDNFASGVVAETTSGITGGANGNIAYGATLYDDILLPLWAEGQVGPNGGDVTVDGTIANTAFRANTRAWGETTGSEDKLNEYENVATALFNSDMTAYSQFRGKGGGRTALGFEALFAIVMIAIIRIPCSILLLMGLVVIRFVVMFIPIWALFGLFEATRPTALAAGKMVFAACYNAAVFGVFGVVHTVVVAQIIASGATSFTFLKLVLILVLTLVTWVVSRPFRSVTVPATGDVLSGTGQQMSQSMHRRTAALGAFFGTYAANRLANRRRRGQDGQDAAQTPIPGSDAPPTSAQGTGTAAQNDGWSQETYAMETPSDPRPRRIRPELRNPVASVQSPVSLRNPVEWTPGDKPGEFKPKLRGPVQFRKPVSFRSPVGFSDRNAADPSEGTPPPAPASVSYDGSTWQPPGSEANLTETMRYRRDRERFQEPVTLWTGPDTPPVTLSLPPTGAYDNPDAYQPPASITEEPSGWVQTPPSERPQWSPPSQAKIDEWREVRMRQRQVEVRRDQIARALADQQQPATPAPAPAPTPPPRVVSRPPAYSAYQAPPTVPTVRITPAPSPAPSTPAPAAPPPVVERPAAPRPTPPPAPAVPPPASPAPGPVLPDGQLSAREEAAIADRQAAAIRGEDQARQQAADAMRAWAQGPSDGPSVTWPTRGE